MTSLTSSLAISKHDFPIADADNSAPLWQDIAVRWLETKNSPRTSSLYASILSEFFHFTGASDPSEVRLADFPDFKRSLEDSGNAPRTIALKLSAVRGFFIWLSNLGLIPLTPSQLSFACPSPRFNKPRKESFDSFDLARLKAHFESKTDSGSLASHRDRLILYLLLHTGCRVAELTGSRVADVMVREGFPFLRVTGKGNKTRDIDLSADAFALIREWWNRIGLEPSNRTDRNRPLIEAFEYHGSYKLIAGNSVSTRAVEYTVKRILADAGIDKPLSPHSARHTCARMMVTAGATAFDVQARLGHASVATANEYVTERDTVTAQINRFAPGV